MEYAMCTLITGERRLSSLVGVSVHELMHSWYQFVLATNESRYAWMDEGFTSFASAEVMNHLSAKGLLPGAEAEANPHIETLAGLAAFTNRGPAEALSIHADHFQTNSAYGVGSYVKGQAFLYQLRSIIGTEAFNRGMLRYYNTWKFRHPDPADFIRIMEKESGQVLDWYLEYMMNTIHQVDYAVDSVYRSSGRQSEIIIERVGNMPVPIEVVVMSKSGRRLHYLIPIDLQRGHAPVSNKTVLSDWPWVNPTYTIQVPIAFEDISRAEVDPEYHYSEADKSNNIYPAQSTEGE